MKILLLTQWFDPEPTFKGLFFAKELRRRGYEVEVITGFPNYPGGKLYDGYRIRPHQREVVDGILINRVPLYPSHDRSAWKRILNYVSFFISATLFGLFSAKKADVIYVYHPPLTVGMAGALIGFFRRTPFVYDIQDLWPDTLRATGMITSRKFLAAISWFCSWVYRRAAHVVVLSPGFRQKLIDRGVPEDKVSIIYNWCDESALQLTEPLREGTLPEGFNVVFAGNMGEAQALDAVLSAAEYLLETSLKINFVFIGSGTQTDDLKSQVSARNIKNVRFLARMPMSEVGSIMHAADALLVHLKNDDLFKITIPSKTQAYMAIGRPIIMAVNGDACDLIKVANCGVYCEPQNALMLAEKVKYLVGLPKEELEKMGDRAKDFYKNKLSLKIGVDKFSEIFQKVAIKSKK